MMHFGFKQLISAGGPILFILIGLSIYSIALIWERWNTFRKTFRGMKPFLKKIIGLIRNGKTVQATKICQTHSGIYSEIILKVIDNYGTAFEKREIAEKSIEWHTSHLSKHLTALATIGSISPFIGLLGTVIGIIKAFRDLSLYAGAGPSVVAMGIAEALINTAAGLFVAIPAIIAYNYFAGQINKFSSEMNWLTEEAISKMRAGDFNR